MRKRKYYKCYKYLENIKYNGKFIQVVLLFCIYLLTLLPNIVLATTADFAIYREASGLEAITTTVSDQAWDTTVSQASMYSINAGRTLVTLSEQGHYLVVYNIGAETNTGSNRSEVQGTINLNGTDLAYGRATCFIRRTGGTDECWLAGSAIINTTATNQDLKITSQLTDNNSATVRRRAGESGLSVVRLDDNWDYLRSTDTTGGQSFNTTNFTTVTFDNNDEIDSAQFSRSGGDITLVEAGHYLVTSNVWFQNSSGNARRNNVTRLTLNGYELRGTRTTAHLRGSNSTQDHVAVYSGIIEATTTSQILRLQGACEGDSCGGITNLANGTAISIAKLPDNADFVSLTESTGGQAVDGSADPILWDTQIEVDSNSFSHDTVTNSSRIEIDSSGDYMFFGSFFSDRTTASSDRLYPHWEWRASGGTPLTYGSFGQFSRGNQGGAGTYTAGSSGGVIFNALADTDYIELINTDESTGVDATANFPGDRIGMQGVRLDTLIGPDISVSATSTQIATTTMPVADVYLGGAFVLTDISGVHTITDITITEKGTIDASSGLGNIKMFYDLDTSDPHDCASESYEGGESQFGSTDTDGFSSANGTSTFSGSVVASTTATMCAYVVVTTGGTALDGETIEIEISDPSVDVLLTAGLVEPSTAVLIAGTTVLENDNLTMTNYHWRNDDGSESGATSATGGSEDTPLSAVAKAETVRLRAQVSNEGSADSDSTQFRIEYGVKVTTCSSVSAWTDVGAIGGDFDMSDSANLTEGADTTNIAIGIGGTTDANTTFLTTNGGVRDTTSQTGGLVLTSTEFVELEYSFLATASAVDGTSYCMRVSDAGSALPVYDTYAEVTISSDITLSAIGAQIATTSVPATDVYIGGAFVITEHIDSRAVASITITENGTIDAQNDLDNIKLFYDVDVSDPYNCASESYSGGELQFGSTDTDGFSGANGTSVFTGSVDISTTTSMCIYTVLDVSANATDGETIEIEVTDPPNEIATSPSSAVAPSNAVLLPDTTTLEAENITLVRYHWRNDNGSEADATSATGGSEDTLRANLDKNTTVRLRLEVSNEGSATSSSKQYRLEYAKKTTQCSSIVTWTDVGAGGGDFDMSNSANLTDGDNTTNIAVSTGGTTDANTVFLTPNAGVKDTSSETAGIILEPEEFVELEYSIEATDNAVFGDTYCFRVSDAGTDLKTYSTYAELSIRANLDFFIQRGFVTISGASSTITAGIDYTAPSASTTAFVRITNTQITGAGNNTGGGNQNANDVTAYVSNPSDILNNIKFNRIGTTNNTRVSWEIIEYIGPTGGDNEIIVREQRATTFGSSALVSSTTVSGVVDNNDVVVFVTGQASPNTGRNGYNTTLATSNWAGASNEAVLERGEAGGDAIEVSWALVEFVGPNWKIQRKAHTYVQQVSAETESITPVNSLSKAFLHVQKRVGTSENGNDEFGQEVWLSGVGQISFQLQSTVSTPSLHTAVAWVIENTQILGVPMVVTRSNGSTLGGSEPLALNVSIGATVADLTTTSIFTNNRSSGTGTNFPRSIMGVRLISTTQYELWLSDTGATQTYRTEVIEWPTAVRTVNQNYYRFYVNNDALDPTDPWPVGGTDLGENTAITTNDIPPSTGDVLRLRVTLKVAGANLPALSKAFKLQYGELVTSCSAIVSWVDVGAVGSGEIWRAYNAVPADGTALSIDPPTVGDLNISVSDRAGTYEEDNPSVANPFKVSIGEDVEYDWVIQHNGATDQTTYCFRILESNDSLLDGYNFYPTLTTSGYVPISQNWRWYDDEVNETPTSPLAGENISPADIVNENTIKLRVTIKETAGKAGNNVKFKLQFSEFSDFSSGVSDVMYIANCQSNSLWCYDDGAGVDNATTSSTVLTDVDACTGGVGNGCGMHNEAPTTTSTFAQQPQSATEFEFTIKHAGARANAVYFFRAYDVVNNAPVSASTTYPSLVTEGATLTFTISGVANSTATEGIVTDIDTTSTSVPFGTLPIGTEVEGAQRLNVSTNATGGYQIYVYQRQGLERSGSVEIPPITGINSSPTGWSVGCVVSATGCYGYHSGDDILAGDSTRFSADDTYAQFDTTPKEIIYNNGPVSAEINDIIFKTQIQADQPAGVYESSVVYIIVPSF